MTRERRVGMPCSKKQQGEREPIRAREDGTRQDYNKNGGGSRNGVEEWWPTPQGFLYLHSFGWHGSMAVLYGSTRFFSSFVCSLFLLALNIRLCMLHTKQNTNFAPFSRNRRRREKKKETKRNKTKWILWLHGIILVIGPLSLFQSSSLRDLRGKKKRGKEEGITETHNEFLTTVTAVWYCIQPLVSTCFFACTSLAPMMIVLPPPPPVFHSPLTKHSLAKPYLAREGRREGGRLGMTNLTP